MIKPCRTRSSTDYDEAHRNLAQCSVTEHNDAVPNLKVSRRTISYFFSNIRPSPLVMIVVHNVRVVSGSSTGTSLVQ